MATKRQVEDTTAEVNTAVVVGTLANELEERLLPSGTRAVSFSLTVRVADAKTTSVPMAWFDPPKRLHKIKVGEQVVACGSVVRRFYRTGGGLGSTTEVVVDEAAKVGSAAADRVLARVAAAIEPLVSPDSR